MCRSSRRQRKHADTNVCSTEGRISEGLYILRDSHWQFAKCSHFARRSSALQNCSKMRCSLVLAIASVALAAPAPLIEIADSSRRIPHKYIVKLKDVAARSAREDALSLLSSTADQVYDGGVFNGFAATLETEELELLQNHPDVST
jgi:hypothetical protein